MKRVNYLNIIFFIISFFLFLFSFLKENSFFNIIINFNIASYLNFLNFAFFKKIVNNFLLTLVISFFILFLSVVYVFNVLLKKKRKQLKYIYIPLTLLLFNSISLVKGLNKLFVNNFLLTFFSFLCLSLPVAILICYYFFNDLSFDSYYTSYKLNHNYFIAFKDTILKKISKKLLTIYLYIINIVIYIYFIVNLINGNSFIVSFSYNSIHLPFVCLVLFIVNLCYMIIWRFNSEKNN